MDGRLWDRLHLDGCCWRHLDWLRHLDRHCWGNRLRQLDRRCWDRCHLDRLRHLKRIHRTRHLDRPRWDWRHLDRLRHLQRLRRLKPLHLGQNLLLKEIHLPASMDSAERRVIETNNYISH